MTPRPRHLATLLIAAALAGCGSGPPKPAPESSLPPPPDARMTGLGMRIQTLVAEDPDGYTIARALIRAGASDRSGAAPSDTAAPSTSQARLAAAGIRVVRIPARSFPALLKDLSIVGDAGDRWVGPSPDWTLVISGSPWNFTQQLLMHDGPMTVGAGYARLLVRAWATTTPSEGQTPPAPTLRADIIPQIVETQAGSPFAELLDPKSRRDLLAQGQWLLSLSMETVINADEVLILVPETPGLDWTKLPEPAPPPPPATAPPGAPPPPPEDSSAQPLDRPVTFDKPSAHDAAPEPLLPTLGDALLSDSTPLSRRSRKAIIALIPALSEPAAARPRPR